jgi:hypothetical protein
MGSPPREPAVRRVDHRQRDLLRRAVRFRTAARAILRLTRLSEDIKIQVNWPDETIINADWVCHWDCDKGLYKDGYRRP